MAEPNQLEETPECEGSVLNAQVLFEILQAKKGEPNRFQSFWENDDEDVDEFTQQEIENEPAKRILWAAENDKMTIVQSILDSYPDLVNSRDSDMYTPLHRASYNGHADMVKYLLSHGADINARTIDGWKPLHSACRWNCTATAAVLLDNGADINCQTKGGLTPLHLAASEPDSRETLELLLMNPFIDANIKTNVGETARVICERTSTLYTLFEIVEDSINQLK